MTTIPSSHDDLPSHAGQGGAIARDPKPGPGTQDAPLLDQNEASDEERIEGIVAQTRSDLRGAPIARIERVLTQRFAQVGVEVDPERTAHLAAEIDAR